MHDKQIYIDNQLQRGSLNLNAEFYRCRSAMLRTWLALVESGAPTLEVEEELNGTIGAMWGIAATVAAEGRSAQ